MSKFTELFWRKRKKKRMKQRDHHRGHRPVVKGENRERMKELKNRKREVKGNRHYRTVRNIEREREGHFDSFYFHMSKKKSFFCSKRGILKVGECKIYR